MNYYRISSAFLLLLEILREVCFLLSKKKFHLIFSYLPQVITAVHY